MSGTILKGIGIAAFLIGAAASAATDWVDGKMMDEKIEKKVNEALAGKENDKES